MTQSLLVIAAHPDDEVLGCGGLVALRIKQGWNASVVFMTSGVEGRLPEIPSDGKEIEEAVNKLDCEMRQAAKVLGVSDVRTLGFPDNRMDTVSRMDISHAVRNIIDEIKPDLILTHHAGDYNWDHTITFDAVMMAGRPNPPDFGPSEIWSFEVLSSNERGLQESSRGFHPNIYLDVAKTIDENKRSLS